MGRALCCLVLVACSDRPRPPLVIEEEVPATGTNASPGALAMSHAAVDARCTACHADDTAGVVDAKCLACHEDLAHRIAAGKGLHASIAVTGKACASCHRDHKGRRYDLMGWQAMPGGTQRFDHALAGWPLRGTHERVACDDCHRMQNQQGLRTYMGTFTQCASIGCHAQDQPHRIAKRAMLACDRCHTENVWKPAKARLDFDHDDRAQAAMPLAGKHADVPCMKCHPAGAFVLGRSDPGGCEHCHAKPPGAL